MHNAGSRHDEIASALAKQGITNGNGGRITNQWVIGVVAAARRRGEKVRAPTKQIKVPDGMHVLADGELCRNGCMVYHPSTGAPCSIDAYGQCPCGLDPAEHFITRSMALLYGPDGPLAILDAQALSVA